MEDPKNLEYSLANEGKKEAEFALEEIRKDILDFSEELVKVKNELLDYGKLREEIEELSKTPKDQDALIITLKQSIEFLEEQIKGMGVEEEKMQEFIKRFDGLDRELKDILLKSRTLGEQ